MFPCWPSTKIVQVIMIHQKTWLQGGGAYFSLYIYIEKFKKFSCQKPMDRFQYNFSLVTLYQSCSSRHDSSKNMAARGRGIFSLYIYIENFKNLLVRNRWIQYIVTWQECCFGDLLPRLFKPSWYVKKHGRQGAGLIFRIYLYRKFLNSSCQKPPDRFQYYLAGMLLWWPCTKIVQAIMIRQKTWLLGVGLIFPIYLNRKL